MSRNLIVAWMAIVVLTTGSAGAGILVDHPPHPYGGPAADTDFVSNSGQANYWQVLADDFLLDSPAAVEHLVFWGFYGDDAGQGQSVLPPPGQETMRIRFSLARVSDGFPGQMLFEESSISLARTWTGRNVSGGHPEYRFEIDLSRPFSADAGQTYWIDVAQIGIPESHYRWEFSQPGDGTSFAFMNPTGPDWQSAAPLSSNLAFQLSEVPEPKSLAVFLIFAVAATRPTTGGPRRRLCTYQT